MQKRSRLGREQGGKLRPVPSGVQLPRACFRRDDAVVTCPDSNALDFVFLHLTSVCVDMWPFSDSAASVIARKREQRSAALTFAEIYVESEHGVFLQADGEQTHT
jgi:hypothetical protein